MSNTKQACGHGLVSSNHCKYCLAIERAKKFHAGRNYAKKVLGESYNESLVEYLKAEVTAFNSEGLELYFDKGVLEQIHKHKLKNGII